MSLHMMSCSDMCCTVLLVFMAAIYPGGIYCYVNEEFSDKFEGKPNIVLLLSDDMGWGDLGANWDQLSPFDTSKTSTPTLDKLAKEGLRFTDFHAAASLCTPSRAALLTSRLGLRTGVVDNFGVDSVGGLPNNETTIGKVLLKAGYRTAMFGKWHLGLTKGHHPMDHGFQSYLGVPYSLDMGCCDPPGRNLPECPGCPKGKDLLYPGTNFKKLYTKKEFSQCREDVAVPLLSNRSVISQPVKLKKLSTMYGAFAENFILNSFGSTSPFFLYGAFSHMHVPLMTQNGTNLRENVFQESLQEMDSIVGEIVNAVQKLNHRNRISGLPVQDTLIWFLSDNGPWEVKCELSGSWGPYSGEWQRSRDGGGGGGATKMSVWEGGHRIPSLIYWPSKINGGRISDALLSSLDIMPTLATIAGAKLPENRMFDGIDISDILFNSTKNYLQLPEIVSELDQRILFHPNSGASGKIGDIGAIRVGDYKAVFYSGGLPDCSGYFPPRTDHLKEPLIFNLLEDPAEANPLSLSSEIYKLVKSRVSQAMNSFLQSLKVDNISIADYRTDPAVRPCCDPRSPVCRCPWD